MRRDVPVLIVAMLMALAVPAGLEAPAFGQGGEYGPQTPERPDPASGQNPLAVLQALLENLFDCGAALGFGEQGLAFGLPSGDPAMTASLMPPSIAQSAQTKAPLLRYWENGQPVSEADRSRAIPISNLTISISRSTGFAVAFRAAALPADPSLYPHQFRLAFDLPDRRGGAQNAFAGTGFEEDLIIYARADAPGRFSVWTVAGGAERQIEATVEIAADRVLVRLPLRTVSQISLAAPGIRAILGTVGPAPTRVFHRIPERGAIRLGIPGQLEIDAAGISRMARTRVDLNGDRRDDLYFLDTNGNGTIDALAYDRNTDGRITFVRLEGPNALLGADGNPYEFQRVERTTTGRQQRLIARNAQVAYVVVVEDKNGDGDVADAGEFEGRFAELE